MGCPSVIADFDGASFDRQIDGERLGSQLAAVKLYLIQNGGEWYTLARLSFLLGYPEASISARLRDLRKARHGGYEIARRRVGPGRGQWEYSLVSRLGQA